MPFDVKALDGTTWLAEPNALKRLVARVLAVPTCPTPRDLVEERRAQLEESKQAAATAVRATRGKVGVIPILGPVQQRWTSELSKSGGTALERVAVAFDALMADASVSAIVLEVDSPGGSVYGVEELSDKIFNARAAGGKPIYAIANSMAASAGYWIATAAGNLAVTPGGDVGSVGVYAMHVDTSKALEMDGLTVSLVTAGKYKAEGHPFGPLGDEGRANWQESVDATYAKFTAAVARNRGTTVADVKKNYGQGRVVGAEQAVAAKMADRVMTFDELMAKLVGERSAKGGGSQASIEVRNRWRKQVAEAV